jgi:proline iminopeptidase
VRVEVEPGVRLFFDVAGSGLAATDEEMVEKPTLLLLHGGPGFDHSSFRPYFDRFADTHQVVHLDHRAQGRSDGGDDPAGWNLDTWADDVVRFCDAVGIEQPVVLGNSFGGFVAIHCAARHPGRVARLVLVSTQARRHLEISAARFEALGGAAARDAYVRVFADDDADTAAWIEYAQRCMPLYNVTPSPFGPRRARMSFDVLADFTRSFGTFDIRSDLPAVHCPTLVLVGEDDPMTPVEAAEEILGLLPEGVGRLERFAACGHGTFRDQPDATESVLRAFLAAPSPTVSKSENPADGRPSP